MKYSIVIPFCNEADNVAAVYQETRAVMEATADDFEFVFVDDGSTDRTFSILEEIANWDNRVILVKLRRNYGKTEALVAGFDHATGDCIVALDGDLQHDPRDIPLFLQKIDEGYDVVCGYRVARPGDSLLLKNSIEGGELDDGQAYRRGRSRLRGRLQGLPNESNPANSSIWRIPALHPGSRRDVWGEHLRSAHPDK